MAKLTKKDILHVAKLANLTLTDSQIDKFSKQLSSVVDYIGSLSEVETKGLTPTSQTTGLENVFREDEVKVSTLDQKAALSGTEELNGYFKVKAILEGRTDK